MNFSKIAFLLFSSAFFLFLLIMLPSAMARGSRPIEAPLETVPHVDLNRYLGLWYEVARFEQSFQKGCVGVTAEYALRDDGKISVLNSCFLNSLDGKIKTADGYAYVKDTQTNAKLRVTFFWPFFGDYWIIELADDYSYAVVGAPGRDYLWFLSRTPQMSDEVFNALYKKVEAKGFDMSKLQRTLQPEK